MIYPLIFKFKDVVPSPGFLAGVQVETRVLMVEEGDRWWLYGVSPGGLAQDGATPEEAYLRFREFFKGVLADLAVEAGTLEAFQETLRGFIQDEDQVEARRWMEAREALRSGTLKPEGAIAALEKITDSAPARVLECVRLGLPVESSPTSKPVAPLQSKANQPEYWLSTAA